MWNCRIAAAITVAAVLMGCEVMTEEVIDRQLVPMRVQMVIPKTHNRNFGVIMIELGTGQVHEHRSIRCKAEERYKVGVELQMLVRTVERTHSNGDVSVRREVVFEC